MPHNIKCLQNLLMYIQAGGMLNFGYYTQADYMNALLDAIRSLKQE